MGKHSDLGVLNAVAEGGFNSGAVFGRSESLDLQQCLGQAVRQHVRAFQDLGEGIEIMFVVGPRVGEEIFRGQKVSEAFEELNQKQPADLTENVRIRKEFELG